MYNFVLQMEQLIVLLVNARRFSVHGHKSWGTATAELLSVWPRMVWLEILHIWWYV